MHSPMRAPVTEIRDKMPAREWVSPRKPLSAPSAPRPPGGTVSFEIWSHVRRRKFGCPGPGWQARTWMLAVDGKATFLSLYVKLGTMLGHRQNIDPELALSRDGLSA